MQNYFRSAYGLICDHYLDEKTLTEGLLGPRQFIIYSSQAGQKSFASSGPKEQRRRKNPAPEFKNTQKSYSGQGKAE
jgi:hypothetical protein